MKKFWAVLAGLAIAVMVVIVSDIISHKIYPIPEGLDFTDPEQVTAYMKVVPMGALFAVIIGQVAAMTLGGLIVIKMAQETKSVHIFSLLYILLCIMNLVMITHPTWFAIASIAALSIVYLLLLKVVPKN